MTISGRSGFSVACRQASGCVFHQSMVTGCGWRSERGSSTASNSASTVPATSHATEAKLSIELSSGDGPSASMSVTTKVTMSVVSVNACSASPALPTHR